MRLEPAGGYQVERRCGSAVPAGCAGSTRAEKQTIIADGETLWFVQPVDNQVLKAPLANAFESRTPVSFLLGVARIEQDFRATLLAPADDGLLRLQLDPAKGDDGSLGALILDVDPKTYDVAAATVRDPLGNTTRVDLHDLRRNGTVDDALFRFERPSGMDVIQAPPGARKDRGLPSFDVVSKVDMQEVANALQQARKEILQRYDFKGSKTEIEQEKNVVKITSDNDFKVKAVVDILQSKFVKRSINLKSLEYGKIEAAGGSLARQLITIHQGLDTDAAREVVKLIKDQIKVRRSAGRRCASPARSATSCRP
jgi:uncharacterized protein YajQ (UPF0234 family)